MRERVHDPSESWRQYLRADLLRAGTSRQAAVVIACVGGMLYFASPDCSDNADTIWTEFDDAMADVVRFCTTWAPEDRTHRVLLPVLLWALTYCPVSLQCCDVPLRELNRYCSLPWNYLAPFCVQDSTRRRNVEAGRSGDRRGCGGWVVMIASLPHCIIITSSHLNSTPAPRSHGPRPSYLLARLRASIAPCALSHVPQEYTAQGSGCSVVGTLR